MPGDIIWSCPDCDDDLIDDGDGFWCGDCQSSYSYSRVAAYADREAS